MNQSLETKKCISKELKYASLLLFAFIGHMCLYESASLFLQSLSSIM